MTFLNLAAVSIAAAVIPTLLILYFLKLRRREELVPSTLLWKKAVQDLQVNAPFQKLRKNLLLFLQLLLLSAGIVALMRPVIATSAQTEGRVVILIDRSASMNTREGNESRLDQAKEQAVRLVRSMNQKGAKWFSWFGAQPTTEAMVITFGRRAAPLAAFTSNTSDLIGLIRAIEPSDTSTDLKEALLLAEADIAAPTMVTDKTPVSATPPARLILISDGCIPGTEELSLKGAEMEMIRVGATADNAGLTAMRAARNYEQPDQVSVFLQLENFGPAPLTTDVALLVDGTLQSVKGVSLGAAADPAKEAERAADALPSRSALSFDLNLPRAALLEARLSRPDALAADNSAYAVVPAPQRLRVLVVTKGNSFLNSVMHGLPLQDYPFVTPEQYEAHRREYEEDGHSKFDAVVFDKYAPAQLPTGNFMFFGALPPVEQIKETGTLEDHAVIWWDETHPVMRYVTLDNVYVLSSKVISVPSEAQQLIEGPKGPLLVRYSKDSRNYLVLTFPIEKSTWWREPTFPAFVYNALRYLGGGAAEAEETVRRPGDPLRIALPAGATETKLSRPDGQTVRLKGDASGVAYYGGTDRVGVYVASPGVSDRDRFAVNLEDSGESDIAPRDTLKIGGQAVAAGSQIKESMPEIWRWFVGMALLVALVEWYIYNRRVMI